MIQDILPHRYDNSFKRPRLTKNAFLMYIAKGNILFARRKERGERDCREAIYESERALPEPDEFGPPIAGEVDEAGLVPKLSERAEYLFSIDDIPYFMVRSRDSDPAAALLTQEKTGRDGQEKGREAAGFSFQGAAYFRIMQPEYQAFASITAIQLWRWKESRKFCGRCGHGTVDSQSERALVCPACGQTEYPKICPAVIVAVTDKDRILMSRYRGRAYRGYALIAGFVEIGETFEETVRREVMEEVGLKVKNIRYYKSQPWAFTDTEMIGFFAELDGDDRIRLQEDELSEAGWYHRDEIPEDTSLISVGSEMKMAFKYGMI